MFHRPLRRISIVIAAFAIASLGAVCLAGDALVPRNASPLTTAPAQLSAPGTAAVRAYLNPETGELDLGPSSAAVQFDPDTEQALRRDTSGLTEVRRADGTVLIELQGRFQSVSMVHRDADGKIIVCTDDDNRARKVLQGDLAAPVTPEVK